MTMGPVCEFCGKPHPTLGRKRRRYVLQFREWNGETVRSWTDFGSKRAAKDFAAFIGVTNFEVIPL